MDEYEVEFRQVAIVSACNEEEAIQKAKSLIDLEDKPYVYVNGKLKEG